MAEVHRPGNRPTFSRGSQREAAALPWFLIHTQPCREYAVIAKLESQGADCFLPLTHQKRATGKLCALFPSYLFANFPFAIHRDINDSLSRLPLLGRVVYFSGQPAIVAPEVIEEITMRLDVNGCLEMECSAQFKPGDRVRVTSGPLQGFEGLFDQNLSGQDRAQILVNTVAHYAGGWTCSRETRELKGGAFKAMVDTGSLALA